jgi:putative ABC transport system permease protein
LLRRRSRAAALGAGIIIAATSFIVLTAASRTKAIEIRGSVKSNYRAAYDVLVRPQGARTPLEGRERLIRSNYLSGVFGGITLRQWATIKRIRGVEVAAPIVNVGYINLLGFAFVPLDGFLTKAPYQLYRVRYRFLANNDSWSYPVGTEYVYYTRVHRMVATSSAGLSELIPCRKGCAPFNFRAVHPCDGGLTARGASANSPFSNAVYQSCFSARSPGGGSDAPLLSQGRRPYGRVGSISSLQFPIFLAGIDPAAEAKLLRVDRTVVSGRYLHASEQPWLVDNSRGSFKSYLLTVPVIASTKTFVDERLVADVSRVDLPQANVPDLLASGFAYQTVTRLNARPLVRRSFSAQSIYSRMLANRRRGSLSAQLYWTTSPVTYRRKAGSSLEPVPTRNPKSVWQYLGGGYWPAPLANADTQFRRLHNRASLNSWTEANVYRQPQLRLVGRYEPGRLPEFSSLSRVPLETYYPPLLEPANNVSARALGGRPLLPTENVGDYIQQPPLLLTSIQGALPFLSSTFYHRARHHNAPIAAIRVRVQGVAGPDALSQTRVRTVAQLIHDKTGLDVDITAGSSPHPSLVSLPKGKLGRPPLLLREGWSKKGVAVSFVKALDRKDLALFALILVIGAFFLGNGALAAARARRTEIGTLLTLGWSRRSIFVAVVAELVIIGLLAGMLGIGVAAVLVLAFGLDAPIVVTLSVLPTAIALAAIAGLLPAWIAARGTPLDGLRPPVEAGTHRRVVRHLLVLALVNLRRMPARTAIGAGGLAVGVAALTILLAIQRAFEGTLVGTVLGSALSLQVRGSDYIAVGLTIALAALAIADVLYLNLRERAAEFVTLRSIGWAERHLALVVLSEAAVLGLLGSVVGAVVGIAIGAMVFGVPLGPLGLTAGAAIVGGTAVAVATSIVPLSQLARLTTPTVLAAE